MIYQDYAFHVPPEKQVRVITDTDAKNEADDQFCIVQTLLSPKLENVGFIGAHFGTRLKDSMERSVRELELIFDTMGFDKFIMARLTPFLPKANRWILMALG